MVQYEPGRPVYVEHPFVIWRVPLREEELENDGDAPFEVADRATDAGVVGEVDR
jgi:hypothetical protein